MITFFNLKVNKQVFVLNILNLLLNFHFILEQVIVSGLFTFILDQVDFDWFFVF